MRHSSRLIAIAICLFAPASSQKIWAQSLDSIARATGEYPPQCSRASSNSTIPVVCHQTWQAQNDQVSGAGVSTATSNYGFLAIGGSAACDSVFNPPLCSESAYAAAEFADSVTFENLPDGQSFVNVIFGTGIYTPNGYSVAAVSETVNIIGRGSG